MAKSQTPWTYIGGKTLMFQEIAEINKTDPKKGLEEVELYLKRIREILEELNRRNYEIGKSQGGAPYVATVTDSNAKGTGWYDCTIERYLSDGTTENVGTGIVLNIVDVAVDPATAGLGVGEQIECWKLSSNTSGDLYYGVELFGRSIIGLCS